MLSCISCGFMSHLCSLIMYYLTSRAAMYHYINALLLVGSEFLFLSS